MCVNTLYWCFSFGLISLCIIGRAGYLNWCLIQKPVFLTYAHTGLVFSHWTLNCSTFLLVTDTITEVIIWTKWEKCCKEGVDLALWNKKLPGMPFRQEYANNGGSYWVFTESGILPLFSDSFKKYLLWTYYALGTFLRMKDTSKHETNILVFFNLALQ